MKLSATERLFWNCGYRTGLAGRDRHDVDCIVQDKYKAAWLTGWIDGQEMRAKLSPKTA